MDIISKLVSKLLPYNYEIGSSYWVEVTHLNDPLSFYVRPTAYKKYLSKVQEYGEKLDPAAITIGKIVVFKCDALNSFVRGQVMFLEENTCDVFAIDYGVLEKSISKDHIFTPSYGLEIQALAAHCQLADCEPIGEEWTPREIDAMKHIINNERCKMIIRDNSAACLIVELINTCPDDVATTLALFGYTRLGYRRKDYSRFIGNSAKSYFIFKQLNVDDTFRVRVQAGKTLKEFYVAEVSDYKVYLEQRLNFTAFSKQESRMQPEDLKEDMPVSVFMDVTSRYERGIIKKITVPETKALVQLVDWGNSLEVNLLFMRKMSKKFYFYPPTAIYCSVDKSQTWDNKLHKFLYPGFEFLIKIKEVGDKFNSPNIVTIMPL